MKNLVENGAWSEVTPVFPTASPSNWSSISTGAWPKTHGVTDMVVHLPGTHLTEIKSGFYSDLCQAEQIWVTAERFGKKVILSKFMCSWPPTIKKGIQLEGFGAPGGPGARPWGSSPLAVSNSTCYTTGNLQNATTITFSRAEISDWKNIVHQSNMPPLESKIKIGPGQGVNFWILVMASNSQNVYDVAVISKYKDLGKGFLLGKRESSEWLFEDFNLGSKQSVRGSFRMKLIDIGSNNKLEGFRLYVSQIFPVTGWTFPEEVAADLIRECGPFLESISHFPYAFGWIDESTYLDDISYQAEWLSKAARYLMSTNEWDLYMTHWHGIDNTQHAFLRFDKSGLTEEQSTLSERVVLTAYEVADKMVGEIVSSAARFGTQSSSQTDSEKNDTYTFVISDHGQVVSTKRFFINQYLYQHEFIKLKRDATSGKVVIDWQNTKAFAQGMVSIYLNLKGREPEGSVAPGDNYEEIVKKLIDLLYDIKDPATGSRVVSLALPNRDSEFLGLTGERTGDIIFASNPPYVLDNRIRFDGDLFEDLVTGLRGGSVHGQQLPTIDLGKNGMIRSMFIAHGPRIKKGYVREKPINMIDIAPTIAHILNIPPPKNSEGKIIFDMLE